MTLGDRKTMLICPLTAQTVGGMIAMRDRALARGADTVEFRLDFLHTWPSPQDLAAMLAGVGAPAIVTCRPVREGGRYAGDEQARLALLAAAAGFPNVIVDLEKDVPLRPEVRRPRIRSRHDFHGCPDELEAIYRDLAGEGEIPKLAFTAAGPDQALRALDLLARAPGPGIALAMGESGVLSRVLAGKFGAYGTFAALSAGEGSAPGQPTIEEFKTLYRWDSIGPRTEVYGVIGHPISHSMSPAIHNAAFAAAAVDAVYLSLLVPPGAGPFNRFMDALLAREWLDWRGLSVTIPHKENAMAYLGAARCDEMAARIGAINTITISPGGVLRGDNTDYAAAIDTLCTAMGIARPDLSGRAVAVLGAGGVARAIVAGLRHYGASVTIYNRTLDRAQSLGEEFACGAEPLDQAGRTDAEILINCTEVGMHPKVGDCPIGAIPAGVRVVFDIIYNPAETELVRRARRAGCATVTGVDMFVNQAVAQFEIWMKKDAPREIMRDVVVNRLMGEGDWSLK